MTASLQSAHGVEISLRIGQHVRHRDHLGKRVTGIVNSLQVEAEQGLTASVVLDEPIIIPARGENDREIRINWQTAPVTEFAPFDERDEQIAELLAVLVEASDHLAEMYAKHQTKIGPFASQSQPINVKARATIAKVTGSAA